MGIVIIRDDDSGKPKEIKPSSIFSNPLPRINHVPKINCSGTIHGVQSGISVLSGITPVLAHTGIVDLSGQLLIFDRTSGKISLDPSNIKIENPLEKPSIQPKILFKDAKIRQRPNISIDNLQTLFPKQKKEIIKEAYNYIITTNFEKIDESQLLTYGSEIQKQHSVILEQLMILGQDTVIEKTKKLINEIVGILESLDPNKFFTPCSTGTISSIFIKFKNKIDDKADQFNNKYKELQSKVNNLNLFVPQLIEIRSKFDIVLDKLNDLVSKIELPILISTILADPNYSKPEIADIFNRRESSLAMTQAALVGNLQQVNLFRDFISHLKESIEETLHNELTAWYSAYLGFISLKLHTDNPDFSTLSEQQKTLVTKLKQ